MWRSACVTACAAISLPAVCLAQEAPANGLQKLMYYRSFLQDSQDCAVTVESGRPSFSEAVSGSAAATCPDAFAWVQFLEAIAGLNAGTAEPVPFWNWGVDQTVWMNEPLPLCTEANQTDCCDPNAQIDPSGPMPEHCPVFRGDYYDPGPLPAQPHGAPSGNTLSHSGLRLADEIDPGRLLRDMELEWVFRNKPFVDYTYRNDLYNKEGLGARNQAQNDALSSGDIARAHALEVRYPTDAVIVKVDLLHQDVMLATGLIQGEDADGNPVEPPNNPEFPYLTVDVQNPAEGSVNGLYYVLAMTNASKDLPIWHWYAIEHVANLGRCDYIGCNDSFGYAAGTESESGAVFGSTYIPPMTVLNNNLATQPDEPDPNSPLFVTGKVYLPEMTGESMTPELEALFDALDIGTAEADANPDVLAPQDPAWRNYRLKGTQTTFVTPTGIPTGTGATITEGGFVNSASCTSCHSQASVDETGNSGMQGVGSDWTPNLLGFDRIVMGAPSMAWFYSNGGPSVEATQVDFIWGILGAQCVEKVITEVGGKETVVPSCKSYPTSPTIISAE
ncbi:hypothetical protein [Palleronia pelagia]|uniref:Cytochrome c domain-containing protein n=1 Tax=Palleronia pelagia TaxID=387096 RepID=A0A1H8LBU4_9RHOB|nr:hypothetical protein [Palleronia pelagia]SEO02650.1 hypothetical protein SAMN04488011_1109 [Palleronia pelagia]